MESMRLHSGRFSVEGEPPQQMSDDPQRHPGLYICLFSQAENLHSAASRFLTSPIGHFVYAAVLSVVAHRYFSHRDSTRAPLPQD